MSGFIYAMRAGDFIKFGWAKDVDARRLQLQTGCPQKIEVVATAQWPREFEPAIHRKLQDHNTQGEWFVSGPEADEVVEMMKADDFSPLEAFVQEKQSPSLGFLNSPYKLAKEFATAFGLILDADLTKNQFALFCTLLEEVRSDGVIDVPNWIISDKLGIQAANVSRDMKVLVNAGILNSPKVRPGRYSMNSPYEWASIRRSRKEQAGQEPAET